ncbi:7142_t:CDS:1, partial [Gigaspora margarita]
IRSILTKTYNESILELLESLEEIEKDLKLVLPYAIPIKEGEHLVPTIRALRKIY